MLLPCTIKLMLFVVLGDHDFALLANRGETKKNGKVDLLAIV